MFEDGLMKCEIIMLNDDALAYVSIQTKGSGETLVNFYKSTRCRIPEGTLRQNKLILYCRYLRLTRNSR
jgi:hypothetical protein